MQTFVDIHLRFRRSLLADLSGSYSRRCQDGTKFPPPTRSVEQKKLNDNSFVISLLQETLRTTETTFQCREYHSGIFINGTPRGHATSKSTGLYSRQSSFFETKDHPSRIGQFSKFWIINDSELVALAKIFSYHEVCDPFECASRPMVYFE